MALALGNNRFEGDFGMPKLPGEPLHYESGDYVRLAALELMAREIRAGSVPGAAAELGVYRGSFAARINALLPERTLYLFDTFEGFAPQDAQSADGVCRHDWSDTSPETVLARLPHPEAAVIRKGRFPETAEGLEELRFCLVSLDADLYAPTLAGLRFFRPRLSPGGYIMVHDYANTDYPGAAEALRQFCAETGDAFVPLPDICGSAVIACSSR